MYACVTRVWFFRQESLVFMHTALLFKQQGKPVMKFSSIFYLANLSAEDDHTVYTVDKEIRFDVGFSFC